MPPPPLFCVKQTFHYNGPQDGQPGNARFGYAGGKAQANKPTAKASRYNPVVCVPKQVPEKGGGGYMSLPRVYAPAARRDRQTDRNFSPTFGTIARFAMVRKLLSASRPSHHAASISAPGAAGSVLTAALIAFVARNASFEEAGGRVERVLEVTLTMDGG